MRVSGILWSCIDEYKSGIITKWEECKVKLLVVAQPFAVPRGGRWLQLTENAHVLFLMTPYDLFMVLKRHPNSSLIDLVKVGFWFSTASSMK